MNSESGPKRLLILDDDADFRKLVITFLGKMFTDVELVEYDPLTQGIPDEDFNWSKYDVLLLDYNINTNGMTGLDIIQANRKNKLFPATIMLTGAGNEEVAVRAIKAGVADYLSKMMLQKEELRDSILEAYRKHQEEREKQSELTSQSHAFNKALFYQQLEHTGKDPNTPDRLLLLLELDNSEALEESYGIIFRDNIIRHIAKHSFEVFQIGKCNPSITRFSDAAIALLIDDPGTTDAVEFNLDGVCNHLKRRPYKFNDKSLDFTVSIGVVPVKKEFGAAENLIKTARAGVKIARQNDDNSFHIQTKPLQPEKPAEERHEAEIIEGKTPAAAAEQIPVATPVAPAAEAPAGQETAVETKVTPAPAAPTAPVEPEAEKITTEEKGPSKAEVENILLKIKKAFDEKRIIQTFQPVISFIEDESAPEQDIYNVSLQLIDIDSSIMHEDELYTYTNSTAFRKYIDRWMLREIIGRIIHSGNKHIFIIKLSDDSLSDATLFNWLRKLLSGFDKQNPGASIAIEISASDFAACKKQAEALTSYLSKSHDFRFVLGCSGKIDEITYLNGKTKFDLLKIKHEMVSELQDTIVDEENNLTLLAKIRAADTRIIAEGVEDATTLTEMIGAGVDYAIGNFIGEPTTQLDEITNVESFEIV